MSAWIVGSNTPGCIPEQTPSAFRTRDDALGALQEEVAELGAPSFAAGLFAEELTPGYGDVTVIATPSEGSHRVFFLAESDEAYYAYPDGYGPNQSYNEDIMTPEDALLDFMSDLPEPDDKGSLRDVALRAYREGADPEINIATIKSAIEDAGIDLMAMGYPMPELV